MSSSRKDSPLHEILPFRPILTDFAKNLWHLRLFLLAILLFLLLGSAAFFWFEGAYLLPKASTAARCKEVLYVTFSALIPVKVSEYSPKTDLGKCIILSEGLCGFILLGLILWVIQSSMANQRLRKSKYWIFPTSSDF
jgi:hypothetical protein